MITSVATALIGASAAASVQGASLILSPFAVLLNALPLVVIPESVRGGASAIEVWRKLFRIGLASSLFLITLGLALAILPERVGQLILGDSWDGARVVLPIIAFTYFCMAWCSVAMTYLRFQGKSGQLLAATVAYSVTSLVLCTLMAFLTRTAFGVAVGLAVSGVAVATVIISYVRPAR
jgi:O-antigen/teichoic acid export membrane protein